MKSRCFQDRLAERVLVPFLSQLGTVSSGVPVRKQGPQSIGFSVTRGFPMSPASDLGSPHRPLRKEDASGCRSRPRRGQRNGAARAAGCASLAEPAPQPQYWALCPERLIDMDDSPDSFLPLAGWPSGVYRRARDNAGLVVLNELPDGPDTLLLRLLGTGEVRRKALRQLLLLPPDDFEYVVYLELAKFHGEILHQPSRNADEEEFLEHSRELYQKYLREFEEKARAQGAAALVVGQLEHRFGKLPAWRLIQVEQGSAEQMKTWAERLLTAATLDAVFGEPAAETR